MQESNNVSISSLLAAGSNRLSQPPAFHLDDDNIYVLGAGGDRRGPFKIASVESESHPIKYTLKSRDGTAVDNGQKFEELRLAKGA